MMKKTGKTSREFKTPIFRRLKVPDSRDQAITAILHIDEIILKTLEFEQLTERIVNVVLEELGYLKLGYVMIVLSLIDKRRNILERISISKTKEAAEALKLSPVTFKKIEFSLEEEENFCVKAVKNRQAYITRDLSDMLYPAIERDFVRAVQKKLKVKTSIVLPIFARDEAVGTIIFSLNKGEEKISVFEKQILVGFTNAIGIAVEHASLYGRLRRTNRRLKEVSALKDEFVYLASHELRTPLTAISGSLSTILEGYAGKMSREAQEFVEGAYNESQRLIRLVNNLLNISRIEGGRLKFEIKEFSLSAVINLVVEALATQAREKKIDLVFDAPKELILKSDEDKVRELLVNLIGNAIKFTDQGRVAVTAWKQGKLIIAAVEDTGHGILQQDQAKLFKKFARLDGSKSGRKKGGTGLGLYICRNLLKGMGGEIWIMSEHGKGSTFFFTLPC